MEIGTHGLSYVLCIDLLNFTHDLHLNSSVSSSVLLCAVYIQIFFICGTDFISDLSHVISSYNAHVLSEECVKCPDPFVAVCKNVLKHNGNRLHLSLYVVGFLSVISYKSENDCIGILKSQKSIFLIKKENKTLP